MGNIISVPKYFKNQKGLNFIEYDDFACVEFELYQEPGMGEIYVTSNLFGVILDGLKIIHTDNEDIHIMPGNAFFAEKGSYFFSEKITENKKYKCMLFFFDDKFLEYFYGKYRRVNRNTVKSPEESRIFRIEVNNLLKSSIESIVPYFVSKSEYREDIVRLKFEEILMNIMESDKTGSFFNFLTNLLLRSKKDLMYFMRENFSKPLDIEEYAKLSGRSLTTFKRDFRNTFQESPKKWLNQKRLERARNLLENTDKDITDICFDSGYENLSHFIQLFKKHFKITPKQLQMARNQQK